jgi:hypothetical protein
VFENKPRLLESVGFHFLGAQQQFIGSLAD